MSEFETSSKFVVASVDHCYWSSLQSLFSSLTKVIADPSKLKTAVLPLQVRIEFSVSW
jgi:hypothetical protein